MTASEADQLGEGYVPARASSVEAIEIDGEAVLLDEATNRLHRLNPTGALVWACIDGQSTIAEIADDLSREFDHRRDEVLAETLAVVRHLAIEGLLASFEAKSRARWRRRSDVLWRWSLDGVVVLPADADTPVALEGTGPALWTLLGDARDLDALAAKLADEHGADASVIAADIEPVLRELEAVGVVERA